MTVDQAKIRQQLEAELAEITERLEQLEASDPASNPFRDVDNSEEDDSLESERGFRIESVRQRLERRQQDIQAALRRIEEGIYGVCAECGKPIDEERLVALPQAVYCLGCQRRVEG